MTSQKISVFSIPKQKPLGFSDKVSEIPRGTDTQMVEVSVAGKSSVTHIPVAHAQATAVHVPPPAAAVPDGDREDLAAFADNIKDVGKAVV